jgi:hypothetical protein
MIGDIPTITDAHHTHSTYALGNLAVPLSTFTTDNAQSMAAAGLLNQFLVQEAFQNAPPPAPKLPPAKPKEKPMTATPRRLVQVFIADPDENVPLEKSLLYSGKQKLTDATDQELFFEIDIKAILDSHNAERIQFVNKKVKERTEYLEPVKIRELKMVVVNVATF